MEIQFPHGLLEVKTGTGVMDQYRAGEAPNLQQTNETTRDILTKDALLFKEIGTWGISIKQPSAGYSNPSFMALAAPLSETLDENQLHQTHLIYDAPQNVQEEYWRIALASLNELSDMSHNTSSPIYDSFVFLTGHHCRQRQYDGAPSARSVMAHHDHLMVVPQNLEGGIYSADEFGLPTETDTLNQHKNSNMPYELKNFISFVKDGFDENIHIRETPPYGYSFELPNDHHAITDKLATHFSAYKTAMEAADYLERSEMGSNVVAEINNHILIDQKKGRVTQPAFVLYLVPNRNNLTAIVSPMLTGVGGPERAGILLKRGPQYRSRLTEEENSRVVQEFRDMFEMGS